METLTIEILNPKAKQLIYDLVDLELISLRQISPTWNQLWDKLDAKLPQTEPDITESEIMEEIKAYRFKLSDKYKGILSKQQGESLNKHIAEMRSEWTNL